MNADAQSEPQAAAEASPDRDVTRQAMKATAGALAVAVLVFGLWEVRAIVILLLLALTLAAAIRPGVEWLHERRVPQPAAILLFFVAVGGAFGLFVWLAVPPALHQISHALSEGNVDTGPIAQSAGVRERVLTWLQQHLHQLPTGTELLHPVATYGH